MGGSSCRAQPRGHQRDHGATKGTVDLSPPALPKDTQGGFQGLPACMGAGGYKRGMRTGWKQPPLPLSCWGDDVCAKKPFPNTSKASSVLPGLAARSSEATRVPLAAGSCWSHLQGDLGTMAAEKRGRRSSPGASALHGQHMAQHQEEQPRGDTGKNHPGKAATGQNMSQIPSPPGSEDAHIHTHTEQGTQIQTANAFGVFLLFPGGKG